MARAVLQGIYAIRNRKRERVYIGRAKDIYKRWVQHKRELNKGTHSSERMIKDWQADGPEAFEFLILEEVPDSFYLRATEEHYIRLYKADNPEYGYNEYGKATRTGTAAKKSIEEETLQELCKEGENQDQKTPSHYWRKSSLSGKGAYKSGKRTLRSRNSLRRSTEKRSLRHISPVRLRNGDRRGWERLKSLLIRSA